MDSNTEISNRATELQTGAIPLEADTVTLSLPRKPIFDSKQSTVSNSWSLEELLSQPKLLKTIKITADTSGEIWRYKHNWRNVWIDHFRSLRKLFPIKSWTLNFIFQFRSNFQQVGMFNLYYTNIPDALQNYLIGDDGRDDSNLSKFDHQCQLPHKFIMMGEDHDVHMPLEWNSPFASSIDPYDYVPGSAQISDEEGKFEDYDMGTAVLTVPFKMETATGVDSNMSVRIWTYLTNVTYAGYKPYDQII